MYVEEKVVMENVLSVPSRDNVASSELEILYVASLEEHSEDIISFDGVKRNNQKTSLMSSGGGLVEKE